MKGNCALYNFETDLRESHIYPKFAIKYLKKTGSKYLRNVVEPNKREQDGLKLYLLSSKAEQEFGIREKWFAEKIFVPYLNGKLSLNYNENLYYFGISFLWRILLTQFRTSNELKKQWYYSTLKKVETEWTDFLTKGILPRNYHNINLFFTDEIITNTTKLKGVDFYLTRTMDSTIVSSPNKSYLFIYGKFSKFIFWSIIKSPDYGADLYDEEIHPIKGAFDIPQSLEYEPFRIFLGNRIKGFNNLPKANSEQQKKIEHEIMKNPEKFLKSDVWRSISNDLDLEK